MAERGTEYVPAEITVDASLQGTAAVELELERWAELGEQGWHPGNTHIHYDEKEQRPDDRLSLDPRVEDLRMTAISILKRWELEYATNKYAPGFLNEFSSTHYYVQCGEENRHNALGSHSIGYGHVMFLNIRNVVHPVSRGLLVDAFDPDYPPLSYACDDTHRQGGVVIWCHNGQGMEAPVAAALGKLDAFNLFDPQWMDPEYDIYYRMLNAGIKLPASTGSDWFISSANRVYADTGRAFDYDDWLTALKQGKTFITNGPALRLTVADQEPGAEVYTPAGSAAPSERHVAVALRNSPGRDHLQRLGRRGRVLPGRLEERRSDRRPVRSQRWLGGRAPVQQHPRQLRTAHLGAHQPPLPQDRRSLARTSRGRQLVR